MMNQEPDDARLLQLLALAGPRDCIEAAEIDQAELLAFGRGNLPRSRRPSIETHLERCAYCRLLLEEYRADSAASGWGGPRVWWLGTVGLAAAAIVAFLAVVEPPRPPAYELASVDGLVAEQMGTEAPAGDRWRVAKDSVVRVVLRPEVERAIASSATAGVLVETPQGIFRLAEATVRRVEDGDAVAFRLEVRGEELLRARGSRDRVAFVVVESEDALSDLAGRTAPAAGRAGVVDVVVRRVERVPST